MKQLYQQRFEELEKDLNILKLTKFFKNDLWYVDDNLLTKWRTKTKDIISKVCGKDSDYYTEFLKKEEGYTLYTNHDILLDLEAVFIAAKEDYEKGYFSSLRSIVQAEIFDSELEQAQELYDNNYISAAAVITGTVLETTLRELCDKQTPKIPHAKLDKMNSDLSKAGVYNQFKQKEITYLAHIRNSAAHGKRGEFVKEDVKNMIKNVERFVIDYLSN